MAVAMAFVSEARNTGSFGLAQPIQFFDHAPRLRSALVDPGLDLDGVAGVGEVGCRPEQSLRATLDPETHPEQAGVGVMDPDVLRAVLDLAEQLTVPPQVALPLPPREVVVNAVVIRHRRVEHVA